MSRVILPGSVIGVLGSGQLGRMFAIAARRMGYRVHVLSPDDDTPTGQVADVEIQADYQDLDQVAAFARGVDVISFEFENVPVATAEVAARYAPVRPAGQVLHTTQNRRREKTFLRNASLPVTPFVPVQSAADLEAAVATVGLPAVLKTASWGYDGKGQVRVESHQQVGQAWQSFGGRGSHPGTLDRLPVRTLRCGRARSQRRTDVLRSDHQHPPPAHSGRIAGAKRCVLASGLRGGRNCPCRDGASGGGWSALRGILPDGAR